MADFDALWEKLTDFSKADSEGYSQLVADLLTLHKLVLLVDQGQKIHQDPDSTSNALYTRKLLEEKAHQYFSSPNNRDYLMLVLRHPDNANFCRFLYSSATTLMNLQAVVTMQITIYQQKLNAITDDIKAHIEQLPWSAWLKQQGIIACYSMYSSSPLARYESITRWLSDSVESSALKSSIIYTARALVASLIYAAPVAWGGAFAFLSVGTILHATFDTHRIDCRTRTVGPKYLPGPAGLTFGLTSSISLFDAAQHGFFNETLMTISASAGTFVAATFIVGLLCRQSGLSEGAQFMLVMLMTNLIGFLGYHAYERWPEASSDSTESPIPRLT